MVQNFPFHGVYCLKYHEREDTMDNKNTTPLFQMKDALSKVLQSRVHQFEGSQLIVISQKSLEPIISLIRTGSSLS